MFKSKPLEDAVNWSEPLKDTLKIIQNDVDCSFELTLEEWNHYLAITRPPKNCLNWRNRKQILENFRFWVTKRKLIGILGSK